MANNKANDYHQNVPQLDALVILFSELLKQLSNNKESVKITLEKAAAVLASGGITQKRTAKLLGMQKKRVVKATRDIKL